MSCEVLRKRHQQKQGRTPDTLGERLTGSQKFGGPIPSICSKQRLKLKFQALLCSFGNTRGWEVFRA